VGRGRQQHYEARELRTKQIQILSMALTDLSNITKIVVQWGSGYNYCTKQRSVKLPKVCKQV
jgi:hypothetical protein